MRILNFRFLPLLWAGLTLGCAVVTAQNQATNEVSGTLIVGESAKDQRIELKYV